jgi:hypothetical protein
VGSRIAGVRKFCRISFHTGVQHVRLAVVGVLARKPWLSGVAVDARPRAGRRASVGDLENPGAPRGAPEFPRMHPGKEYLIRIFGASTEAREN